MTQGIYTQDPIQGDDNLIMLLNIFQINKPISQYYNRTML
jgi:hypothetical protein